MLGHHFFACSHFRHGRLMCEIGVNPVKFSTYAVLDVIHRSNWYKNNTVGTLSFLYRWSLYAGWTLYRGGPYIQVGL